MFKRRTTDKLRKARNLIVKFSFLAIVLAFAYAIFSQRDSTVIIISEEYKCSGNSCYYTVRLRNTTEKSVSGYLLINGFKIVGNVRDAVEKFSFTDKDKFSLDSFQERSIAGTVKSETMISRLQISVKVIHK